MISCVKCWKIDFRNIYKNMVSVRIFFELFRDVYLFVKFMENRLNNSFYVYFERMLDTMKLKLVNFWFLRSYSFFRFRGFYI